MTENASFKDPVCGMSIEPSNAKAQVEHMGQMYYFCYVGCAEKFKSNPDAYLNKNAPVKDNSKANSYICPMHPEVITDKPGDCPLCGMRLEAMLPTDDNTEDETKAIAKHLAISIILTIPLVALSMTQAYSNMNGWIQFALATPVVCWVAQPFIHRGWYSVKARALNMFTLLSLGITIPYLYSLYSLISQAGASHSHNMLYFESAAVITTLAWFGQLLEAKARVRSASAVKELVSLMPAEATVILPDGSSTVLKLDAIPEGAEVRVKPGERIPVDGKVLNGESYVDESMLSGEPAPIMKNAGSLVSAGTINGNGSLLVEVLRVGNKTLLAQIIDLVSQAQRSKLPVQQLVDKVAAIFVPIVVVIALLTFVVWSVMGAEIAKALTMAVSVLVIACPCALGLATPMSIIAASGRAARAGVLFKDASSLEALSTADTLVIDKTGTLTEGHMSLVGIKPLGTMDKDELLFLAASVETHSEHPIAQAIVAASHNALAVCKDFKSTPGLGVSGTVNGKHIRIGNKSFAGISESAVSEASQATSQVYVAIDEEPVGHLEIADKLRDDALSSIKELQASGVKVILASGDNNESAQAIAKPLGISVVYAPLMPADKATIVKELQNKGSIVAMAGDGINDAPALAQANIGIAMASGTGVAVSSAGIVLLNSDVAGIVRAHKVSQAMLSNIRQNLVLAFGYNILAIPAAAGLFLPITGIALNPMVAAAAMSLSSVSVIANALRLHKLKL